MMNSDTITELKQIMDQNTTILAEVAQHTSRISTSAKKASHAPRSIYDMSFKTLSISEDNASLYSSKLFTFDEEVVNSTAYRHVLAKAYARGGSPAPEDTKEATTDQERDSKSRNEERDSVSGMFWKAVEVSNTSIITIKFPRNFNNDRQRFQPGKSNRSKDCQLRRTQFQRFYER